MTIYIAATAPLPLIPWSDDEPAFNVNELGSEYHDAKVRRQFSKQYVYYVGSHQSCGCGFSYGQYPGFEDNDDEESKKRESVRRLAEYLDQVTRQHGQAELCACWDGDQGEEPEHRGRITPTDIGGDAFWFEEKQFFVVGPSSG